MNVGVTPPILDRVDLIYNSDSLQTAGLVVVAGESTPYRCCKRCFSRPEESL